MIIFSKQFYAGIRWNWFSHTKFQNHWTTKGREVADPSTGSSYKVFFFKKEKWYLGLTYHCFFADISTLWHQQYIYMWEMCFLVFLYNFDC